MIHAAKTGCFITVLIALSCLTHGKDIRSVNEALALNRIAEQVFAEKDFLRAQELFSQVGSYLHSNNVRTGFNQIVYDIPIVSVVSQRAALKMEERPIVHRFLVLYVTTIDIPGSSRRCMDAAYIRRAKTAQENFAGYAELLTDGRMTCTFERYIHDGVVTNIITSTNTFEGKSSFIQKLDITSITPAPAMLKIMPRFDSLLIYWEGTPIGRPTGGIWPIPMGDGRTILRGYMQFHLSYEWPGTLLHEFFHTVEDIYRISPRHGFAGSVRTNFPVWKGTGQYDYYRWHFDQTVKRAGYERMVLRENGD